MKGIEEGLINCRSIFSIKVISSSIPLKLFRIVKGSMLSTAPTELKNLEEDSDLQNFSEHQVL